MTTAQTTDARIPPTKIERGDPRCREVLDKRLNKRFSSSPDYVRLIDSTEKARVAVEKAFNSAAVLSLEARARCDGPRLRRTSPRPYLESPTSPKRISSGPSYETFSQAALYLGT